MKKIKLLLLIILFSATNIFAQDAKAILDAVDNNNTYTDVEIRASITTSDNFGTKISDMKILSRGKIDTLAEAISGLEKGQRFLRTAKEVYVYYPDADQVVRLKGASLRQNVMGSTMSYEDLTSTATLSSTYDPILEKEEQVNGFNTYKLKLTAKEKGATYPIQILWIDKGSSLVVKAEYKSASDKLLRTLDVSKIEKIGGNWYAMNSIYIDTSRKKAMSNFVITNINNNIKLSDKTFSISNLSF